MAAAVAVAASRPFHSRLPPPNFLLEPLAAATKRRKREEAKEAASENEERDVDKYEGGNCGGGRWQRPSSESEKWKNRKRP